ncbi:fungal-specific transcription factor domain-containing protein [Microdochium trichocladiopsis]|uniref:Fungal-specific transcription factor domain-containing protein n=1 Tax=Microdochium trichocladiopsis TaxID=1682393 RepID=A0A9P9BLS7_9PEZI|nr:fungal-specific transcription factor domain-containing protein [Microdochium trichocladiopsis]KAH7028898.1 fungal-specific transcription factor domain-containing protein [Microdochium trichocladiopsis]
MAKHNGAADDMSGSNNNSNNTSGSKRQRVALACNPCRTRKSRCNGARPRCSLCERMSFDCTYDAPGSAANVIIPKDAFADLESRLHLLEQIVKGHHEQLSVRSFSSAASDRGISETSADLDSPAPGITRLLSGQEPELDLDDHTDGMAISFVDEKDQGFFGPSANISFMRIILRSMLAASPASPGPSTVKVKSMSSRTASNTLKEPAQNLGVTLPPEDVMHRLLQQYFANTGLLFPYIHEASFLETYRQARASGFTSVRRTWLALLNIILAMAVRADASRAETPHSARGDEAEPFYKRACLLCGTQMLRGTTLETVQYLLLSTQYLQGTQHAVQTWTTHGLAVKTALSIGLHSKAASAKFPPIEREMRKRTWFGCIVLDRSLSMTFGRPSAIPEDYVRLDLPVPIPGDRERGMSALFFSATVTLYRILWKVIASLYGHNIEQEDIPGPELLTRILGLEQELDQWQTTLPPALQIAPPSFEEAGSPASSRSPSQQIEKLRNIITLRYLNTKLLVMRPILTNMLQTRFMSPGVNNHDEYDHQQQNKFFTTACFGAAVESISLIHAVVTRPDLGKHMLGAWWFTLCYAFNASLTVFGVLLLQPAVPPQDSTEQVPSDVSSPHSQQGGGHLESRQQATRGREALIKAIEALDAMAANNVLVDRCIEHLRQLVHVLDSRKVEADSSNVAKPLSATSTTFPPDCSSFIMCGMPASTSATTTGAGVLVDFSSPKLAMDETSILGMTFPDYHHTMMFEDDPGPGLFFTESSGSGGSGVDAGSDSWMDFGYQL